MKRHPQARHRRSTTARTRRRSAASLSGVGVVALLAALSSPAGAAQPTTPGLSLAFFNGGQGASAHYVPDSVDADTLGGKVIQLINPLSTGTTYAGATVNNVAGMDMNSVTSLSFDIDTDAYMSGGAPRLSIELSNGDTLFPSGGDCPLAANTGWETASFVGDDANCLIYSSIPGAGPETWGGWIGTLGDQTITGMQLIQDEGPATAYVANVTVNGQVAK